MLACMELSVVLRDVADKTSDLLLVAAFFGIQAALAGGLPTNWFA